MKKIFLILTGLLVVVSVLAGFVPGQVTQVYACETPPCNNGAGNSGNSNGSGGDQTDGQGQGGQQDPVGGNAGDIDPCVALGNCGNGDHGQGNPVNGSLHANCRAAQGEVDPVCPVVDPTGTPAPVITPPVPVVTPTPGVTPAPEPGDDDTSTITVDGKEIPFELQPYKSPFVRSGLVELLTKNRMSGPVAPTCDKKDCCCECQADDLGWLKLPIWLIVISLVVIAVAAVLKLFLGHPFLTLLLIAIFVVVRPFLFG